MSWYRSQIHVRYVIENRATSALVVITLGRTRSLREGTDNPTLLPGVFESREVIATEIGGSLQVWGGGVYELMRPLWRKSATAGCSTALREL